MMDGWHGMAWHGMGTDRRGATLQFLEANQCRSMPMVSATVGCKFGYFWAFRPVMLLLLLMLMLVRKHRGGNNWLNHYTKRARALVCVCVLASGPVE